MAEKVHTDAAPRTVEGSESELIRWMSIQDANSAGFIHGGVVMRMCDEVAGIAAIRHSGCRVVTAGMDRMTFASPLYVGELLRCTASVNAAWRTSMEVGVRVEAENALTRDVRHTSTAYLTMVAVDEHGSPSSVPTWRTSSLNRSRSGSSSFRPSVSGRPPTLWWLLIVVAFLVFAPPDSTTSG